MLLLKTTLLMAILVAGLIIIGDSIELFSIESNFIEKVLVDLN